MQSLDERSSAAVVRRIAEAFRDAEEEIYLVGGAVRQQLLGEVALNVDFATSARPETTARILESLRIGSLYRLGEKFGTIALRVGDTTIEITTYRSSEVYTPGSRKPEVRFGDTLLEDLTRRDFTMNAIARDPLTDSIIDPLGGIADLTTGVIRAVGEPEDRFREDPLRLLRAIRFASRLDFAIEDQTWKAVRASGPALQGISRERVRDEYTLVLEGSAPVRALNLLRDAGLLAHSVPQLLELTKMTDHGPRHPLSLWDHTMKVVAGVPPMLLLRWAALLHDIAKPATRSHEPSGRPRFFHHEEVGAQMARSVLADLRYPNTVVDAVSTLVQTHMQVHGYSNTWSDGAVRRLIMRLGTLTEQAIELARADAAGHALGKSAPSSGKFDDLERRIRTMDADAVHDLKSPLSGDQLMARYARPPGPWIRRIKDTLRDEVIEGRLAADDEDSAWRLADQLIAADL
jgi:poly(A) polymerase